MAALSLILALVGVGPLDWPYLGSGSLVGWVYRSRTRIHVSLAEQKVVALECR